MGSFPIGSIMEEEKLYRVGVCNSCCDAQLVEKGNHHPWCMRCVYDIFDYPEYLNGENDSCLTKEEAEQKIKEFYGKS